MRTRDKKRIVKLFLEGWSVTRVQIEMWERLGACYADIESIIREYAIEADARASRREKGRKA